MDSAQLYKAIGDFLAAHGLWPTPDNYALIHALFANEASPAAEAVKAATADGLRLSQRDADRIKSEIGIEVSAAPSPGSMDPALLAAASQRVDEFVAIVEAQRADAQSYGADLWRGPTGSRRGRAARSARWSRSPGRWPCGPSRSSSN